MFKTKKNKVIKSKIASPTKLYWIGKKENVFSQSICIRLLYLYYTHYKNQHYHLKLQQKSYCSSPNTGSSVFIRGDHCEDRIRIYTLKYWWWHHLLKENWTLKSSLSSLKEHLKEQSKLSFSFWFLCFVFEIFQFLCYANYTYYAYYTYTFSDMS